MGFRSYIREFLGAILMLFRLSLPWGFAAGSGSIFGVARAAAAAAAASSYNLFFSMGFRRVAGAGAAAAGGNRRKK